MKIANAICSALLLVCLLALAGCPEVSEGGRESSQSGESRGGGGGD